MLTADGLANTGAGVGDLKQKAAGDLREKFKNHKVTMREPSGKRECCLHLPCVCPYNLDRRPDQFLAELVRLA